jgi:branched-chain amino acid transport system ATP-binding protein
MCWPDAYNQVPNLARSLTLAMRKRLELAKALAMKPRLLFLDEVNAGLNTSEVERAMELPSCLSNT